MLLCYCITHGPQGSVLVAVTVQQQPRSELSPLCRQQTSLPCVYVVRVLLYCVYVSGMCVLSQYQDAAARQHQYNVSMFQAIAFVTVVTVYVCGWCTTDRAPTTFSRSMQRSVTVRRSVKVYAQLARERVVVTQGDDAELSIILSGRRD